MSDDVDLGEDDGVAAFLESLEGKPKEDPKEAPEKPVEAAAPAPKEDEPKEAFEAPKEGEEKPAEDDPDDQEVEWGEGETVTKAKLRDLKSAFQARVQAEAQVKAATELRARADADGTRAGAALTAMLKRAEERYAPYANLDFVLLAHQHTAEDYQQIRNDAISAHKDIQFLKGELDQHVGAERERMANSNREAAQRVNAELADPVKGIKGWGKDLYGQMGDYVASQGLSKADFGTILSPAALRIIHAAMMASSAQKVAEASVKKVVNNPTKLLKPAGSKSGDATGNSKRGAMQALRDNPDDSDMAAAAFLASFS